MRPSLRVEEVVFEPGASAPGSNTASSTLTLLRESLGQSLPQALLTYTFAARTGHSDVPGRTTHHSGELHTPIPLCYYSSRKT